MTTEQQGAGDKHRKSPVRRRGEGRQDHGPPQSGAHAGDRPAGHLPLGNLQRVRVPRLGSDVQSRVPTASSCWVCPRPEAGWSRDQQVCAAGGGPGQRRCRGRGSCHTQKSWQCWDDPTHDSSSRGGLSTLPYLPPASADSGRPLSWALWTLGGEQKGVLCSVPLPLPSLTSPSGTVPVDGTSPWPSTRGPTRTG